MMEILGIHRAPDVPVIVIEYMPAVVDRGKKMSKTARSFCEKRLFLCFEELPDGVAGRRVHLPGPTYPLVSACMSEAG